MASYNLIKSFLVSFITIFLIGLFGSDSSTGLADNNNQSIFDRIKSEVEDLTDCTNGEIVSEEVELIWGDLEKAAEMHPVPFWFFYTPLIGPNEKGLVVQVWSGSAMGNGDFILFRKKGNRIYPIGNFEGCCFKILAGKKAEELYDFCTIWNMGGGTGPYECYRWTGTKYIIYKRVNK
jgi:hypothetical protein